MLQFIQDIILQISPLEWLGVFFGAIQVILAKQNSVWTYLFGLMSICITIIVYSQVGLYAEVALNGYYLIMSVYGWMYWLRGQGKSETRITLMTRQETWIALGISILGSVFLYYILRHFTNSTVPVADAVVSATAWAGMWLMARRKLANWVFLNISNLIAIPLLWYKALYLYAGLSAFLFVIAVLGYFNWKKIYKSYN